MKATETQSTAPSKLSNVQHPGSKYQKVVDGRKQPIRGLWIRGSRYYARLAVEKGDGSKQVRWIPLEEATTIPQAQAELRRLKTRREDNALPVLRRCPKFNQYVAQYFQFLETVRDAKRPATVAKERGALRLWTEHLGETRLDKISRAQINAFMEKRQGQGMSGRTVNLDVIALRNVLKRALEDGWLKSLPTENLRPLKWTSRQRTLITTRDIQAICKAAMETSRNGQQFSDYVRLMAYCGSRWDETLRLKWTDVDWQRRQLAIGSDGLAKNHRSRFVDFNGSLEQHLQDMVARKAPDSEFLFPSPQRGEKNFAAKSFKETLNLARKASGLTSFTFHDLRHYFISASVMAGIDFMTISKWVGHQDGGVLIGKVYGHLADDHRKRMADRLSF